MKKCIAPLLFLTAFYLFAQNHSNEVKLPDGTSFLLGKISRDALQTAPYAQWMERNYTAYTVDGSLVNLFKASLNSTELLLFLGTWCGDSKREVPRVLKILDTANFPNDKLTLIALDKRKESYKKSPGGEEKGWNITRVPTLILLQDGKEVNRIVERPVSSWEEDLQTILSGASYVPNYAN
ncbi:MAG: thioredoxin family protein [Bacteroidota bacterium]